MPPHGLAIGRRTLGLERSVSGWKIATVGR